MRKEISNPKTKYALYEGEKIIYVGTRKEIAQEMGVKESVIRMYGCRTYQKKSYVKANEPDERFLVVFKSEIDCFAFSGKPGEPCRALKVTECEYGKCAFYKPK